MGDQKYYFVYIMTNKHRTVLYIGVTNDLIRRTNEHRAKLIKGFTAKYNIDRLLFFEAHEDIEQAIMREKKLKGSSRSRKVGLIDAMNPGWVDLFDGLVIE